jgi:hypothetical protein
MPIIHSQSSARRKSADRDICRARGPFRETPIYEKRRFLHLKLSRKLLLCNLLSKNTQIWDPPFFHRANPLFTYPHAPLYLTEFFLMASLLYAYCGTMSYMAEIKRRCRVSPLLTSFAFRNPTYEVFKYDFYYRQRPNVSRTQRRRLRNRRGNPCGYPTFLH